MSQEQERATIEHNLHALAMQKQQFQTQLFETEGALKELANTPQAYKIIGGIMVAADKQALIKELEGRKELLDLRIQSIEKQQEKQLKAKKE